MEKKKRGFTFPPAIALLFILIVFSIILTYVVPAGQFNVTTTDSGETVITMDDFQFMDKSPVSFLKIPELIVKGFTSNAALLLAFFLVGGAVDIVVKTGALQAFVALLLRTLHNNRFVTMLLFMTAFVLLSFNVAPRYMLSFVPFFVALAVSLGYDALTGVSMVLLSGAMSYSTSPQGLMTLTAQSYVDLAPLSGIGYRYVCLVTLFIVTFIYTYIYAERVRTGKRESIMAEYGGTVLKDEEKVDLAAKFTFKDGLIMAVYFGGIVACIITGSKGSLTTNAMCVIFMLVGIVVCLINKVHPYEIPERFIESSKMFIGPAVIVALSTAISTIMENGNIIDTTIYYAVKLLLLLPGWAYAPCMFIIQLLINCFIVSGAGQAAITMPLMGPIAKLVGIPLQTSVLAFNFGDGLGDFVIPNSSVLVTFLVAANIPYQAWWKYIKKLALIWIIIGCVLMFVSTLPIVWG